MDCIVYGVPKSETQQSHFHYQCVLGRMKGKAYVLLYYLLGAWFDGLDVHFSPELLVSPKVKVAQSCSTLCDPMTIQSMEFSRPEYWSG